MMTFMDLHLHLDGSLSLKTVRELARRQDIPISSSDQTLLSMLRVSPKSRDLTEYLEKFSFPCSLLQTYEALEIAALRLLEELYMIGVGYAELRFAPQKHTQKGLTQEEAALAVLSGIKKSPIPAKLILCCMRGTDTESANEETVWVAKKYLHQGVCAVDLAGAEGLYPNRQYGELFKELKAKNIPFTVHAGEADGPDGVWAAIEGGARRIGHGVRAAEDLALMAYLAKEKIPLELCPTSNLHTHIFSSLREFPLRTLMENGVIVTVNSDNMTVSDTNVVREIKNLTKAFSLSEEEQEQLLINAANSVF